MARSEDLVIPAQSWTEITNSDVQSITFQNKSDSVPMQVKATAGSVAPVIVDGVVYAPYDGEWGLALETAFPGVTGANRVWVYATREIVVYTEHA